MIGARVLGAGLLFMGVLTGAAADDLPVVGTGDGLEILRAAGAVYTADHSGTVVLVPPSVHSSGGIAAVRTGAAVLGRIARPLTIEERAEGIIE
jgi:phosphate transport system substrate-binding protein